MRARGRRLDKSFSGSLATVSSTSAHCRPRPPIRPCLAWTSIHVMAETLRLPDRAGAGRRRLVLRTELVARLLGSRDARVVLLAAGAGSGKSTLLSQWAGRDRRPFAWVSLDDADDAPAVLAADIGRALDAVDAGVDDEPASRAWYAAIARARPFVLVLDDAQVLRSVSSLALVAALADHLPACCQLALAGRGEPALPLARWSVQGDLV